MTEAKSKPEDQAKVQIEVPAEEPLKAAEEVVVEAVAEVAEEVAEEVAAQETEETAEESALTALQSELVRAQDELVEAKENVLRAMAEAQNTKRRAQLDVEKAHKFALEKFVESLLPVVDSLENGLKISEGTEDPMRQGMELTLKLFLDNLARHGVTQLNPVGEPLDPHFHQAITMVPNPDMEPNTVMDVVQKGYVLNERVVRPAMVVVSRAP